MANTLIKDRTLIEYIPGNEGDPGDPGSPGTPERTVWELRSVRREAAASTMTKNSDGTWTTPLDVLRSTLSNPGLTAVAANYSDVWAATVGSETGALGSRYPVAWTSAWVIRQERVRVTYPATPPRAPRPPVAGSPPRSVYNQHFGWNAGAQSNRTLPASWVGTAMFSVGKPVGAVVGFALASSAPVGRRGSFSNILFGVAIGDGLIRVRERGITGPVIATATGDDDIEARVTGGAIEWHINGTLAHRGSFSMPDTYVMDAVLYSGGDAVDDPSLVDGVDSEPDGANLMLAPLGMTLAGDGEGANLRMVAMSLLASEDEIAQAALTMGGIRVLSVPLPRGSLRVRPLRVSASDQENNGFGVLRLAGPTAVGDIYGGDDAWVPAYSIGALGMLPFTLSAVAISGGVIEAGLSMGPLRVLASEDAYGEARLTMAPMWALADAETITPLVRAQELMGSIQTTQATMYIAIVISETVGAAGVASIAAVTLTAQALEQVGTEDETTLTEHIVAAAMELLGIAEKQTALLFKIVNGQPVLVDEGQAWVVNTDTNASTRYDKYSFNSFMAVGGRHFGIGKNGVYLLEGSDDAGQPIESGVALGKHDFGTQNLKHLPAVYAGVSATGALLLRIGDGKKEYTYRARRVDPDLRTQRFDPGKGLSASYFTFDLMNECGGRFELDNIVFDVLPTKRRI